MKRKKLKVTPKKPQLPTRIDWVAAQPDTVTGTVTTDTATIIALEKACARCDELAKQVAYLNHQLAGATRRDVELSVENLQLKTMRANMFKALGFEAPQ